MHRIRSRFRDYIYGPRRTAALLEPHVAGFHRKLFQRVRKGKWKVNVEQVIHVLAAIHRVSDVVIARSIDRNFFLPAWMYVAVIVARVAAGGHNAGHQQRQVCCIPAIQRKLHDARPIHGVFQRRRPCFNLRGRTHTLTIVLNVAKLELNIDLDVFIRLQQNSGSLVAPERRLFNRQRIASNRKRVELILTICPGGRGPDLTRVHGGKRERGARNAGALLIGHGSKERGGIARLRLRNILHHKEKRDAKPRDSARHGKAPGKLALRSKAGNIDGVANQIYVLYISCQEIFCAANYRGPSDPCLPAAINQVDKSGQNEQRRGAQHENAVIQDSRTLQLLGSGGPKAHYALRQDEMHRQLRR